MAAITLHPYQEKAVKEMKNGCVLYGGVGLGKTLTTLAYYVENESPRDIYVITTAKKRNDMDWEKEATYFDIAYKARENGHGKIVVDSWQNISKYMSIKGAFFIFDEQHASGYGVWARSFINIARSNHWVMLSATPGDQWLDYAALFIAHGFYRNITQFKEEHTVYKHFGGYPQLARYVNERKLSRLRDEILVEMKTERHTVRHVEEFPVSYDKERYNAVMKFRRDPDSGEPYENAADFTQGLRRVVNEDKSRIEALDQILYEHPRMIIFYNFNYELEALIGWATAQDGLKVRQWNGKVHEDVPTSGRWVYLVQYQAAEAWNCTTTDTIVFFSLNYSYKIFEQAQGRIDRMNTPYTDLYYFVLMSNSTIDKRIWAAVGKKKDFNDSALKTWFKKQQKKDAEVGRNLELF